jgi:hypothetical protein
MRLSNGSYFLQTTFRCILCQSLPPGLTPVFVGLSSDGFIFLPKLFSAAGDILSASNAARILMSEASSVWNIWRRWC